MAGAVPLAGSEARELGVLLNQLWGYGGHKLCGGFQPRPAFRFATDRPDTVVLALLCFSCHDVLLFIDRAGVVEELPMRDMGSEANVQALLALSRKAFPDDPILQGGPILQRQLTREEAQELFGSAELLLDDPTSGEVVRVPQVSGDTFGLGGREHKIAASAPLSEEKLKRVIQLIRAAKLPYPGGLGTPRSGLAFRIHRGANSALFFVTEGEISVIGLGQSSSYENPNTAELMALGEALLPEKKRAPRSKR